MTGQDYEKAVTALVCWKQMKSEQYRGMAMFSLMLKNRADAGWFESSIYKNAVAVAVEAGMDWTDFPDAREYQYQQVLQVMDGIFAGTVPDKTGGALYYAHKASVDRIAGETTAEIGQYIFFKD